MTSRILAIGVGVLTLLGVSPAAGQNDDPEARAVDFRNAFPKWFDPFEPFPVVGDVHYVGARGLSSFLITSEDGHILLDGGMPHNAGLIAANIEALGFSLSDVKYLINSHAHMDHSGGLAALKEKTGALLVAHEGDRSALEGGFYLGFENDPRFRAPPVAVDRLIADGEALEIGRVRMTAHHTPGHTRGCTSWMLSAKDRDETYDVLFFCSASVAANRLVDPPLYEGIVDDYRSTFRKIATWTPDVFLANHPEVFQMEDRRARQIEGEADAFLNGGDFQGYVEKSAAAFERALTRQQSEAGGE